MRLPISALILTLTTSAALAETIAGRAAVIDGDTLEIHGERIRILDIDAPESRQTCTRQDGSVWRCGQESALALSDWLGQRAVTCMTDKRDRVPADTWRIAQSLARMWANGWGLRAGSLPYRNCKCEVIQDAAKTAKAAKAGMDCLRGVVQVRYQFKASPDAKLDVEAEPSGQLGMITPAGAGGQVSPRRCVGKSCCSDRATIR